MNYLLAFDGLAIGRGDRTLREGLAGAIRRGEIVHLTGPNGIGKTTLLEVLSGLREPHAGRISPTPEPEACHWIGHRNALNPAFTPRENLEFWCQLQGVPTGMISAALSGFGLQGVADRPCRQLSAGQQRRSALARLSVAPRALWLLDEPLSALDEVATGHWLSLLDSHQRQGGAALITSHQPLPGPRVGVRVWDLSK